MKKVLLPALLLLSVCAATAQTLPFKDFYFLAPMLVNPALAGDKGDPTITLISNVPTVGIDGAPASFNLSYGQGVEKINSGFGAMINKESVGVHSELKQSLMYNYRFKLRGGSELALGGTIFYTSWKSDWNSLYAGGSSSVLTGVSKAESFGYDLGMNYSFARGMKVGLSMINDPITYYGIDGSNILSVKDGRTQVVAFLQRNFILAKWLKLTPSVLVKLPEDVPSILNLNATAYISKWVFVGAQYSNSKNRINSSNIFAGLCYEDVVRVGVKLFRKQYSPFSDEFNPLAFMVQVTPRRGAGKLERFDKAERQ
jgi:type IX secretion system PorP/SprF family membrane protein